MWLPELLGVSRLPGRVWNGALDEPDGQADPGQRQRERDEDG